MQTRFNLIFLGLFLFCLFSCHNNIDLPDSPPETEIEVGDGFPANSVQASVSGLVSDLEGNLLTDAIVYWGNQNVETDENGHFKLSGTVADSRAVLTVKKEGFFPANQTLSAFSGKTTTTAVQLIPKVLSGNISATNGGAIELSNGSKVNFAAAAFVDEDGNSYSGEVEVYAYYLDPTMPDLVEIMPGNLTAINANNEPRALQSFGMLNVELIGSSGQPLQINEPAEIILPVPTSLQSQAPATIPLWHFDEASGLWMEEGEATLEDGYYKGTVNHFSWWNCDAPFPIVYLQGRAKANESVLNLAVKITIVSSGATGTIMTAEDGTFGGSVAQDEVLLLEFIDQCNQIIYSEEIGPFSNNTDLGIIVLDLVPSAYSLISGSAVDCDGNAINNGYVFIKLPVSNIHSTLPIIDGAFTGYIENCNEAEFTIYAIDIDGSFAGEIQTFAISSTVEVGNLEACDTEVTSGITISYDNEEIVLIPCTAEIGVDTSFLLFKATHTQVGGSVEYEFFLLETGNPTAPYIFAEIGNSIVTGTPADMLTFVSENVTLINYTEEPGEIISLESNAFNLSINGTVVSETATMTLHGVVQ